MRFRVHATVDLENAESVQDIYYVVAQVIGTKIMQKLGISDYEMTSGMGMTAIRSPQLDMRISIDPLVKITLSSGEYGIDLNFNKGDSLEDVSNVVAQEYNKLVAPQDEAVA